MDCEWVKKLWYWQTCRESRSPDIQIPQTDTGVIPGPDKTIPFRILLSSDPELSAQGLQTDRLQGCVDHGGLPGLGKVASPRLAEPPRLGPGPPLTEGLVAAGRSAGPDPALGTPGVVQVQGAEPGHVATRSAGGPSRG